MPLKYVSNILFFFLALPLPFNGFGHLPINKIGVWSTTGETDLSQPKILDEYADLAVIEGELQRFHKLTFTWDGPSLTENETTFRDYRLNVKFISPSGKTFKVPGYFAADGDAAETSAVSGNKWRCHFMALETGQWTYEASFRGGSNIAVSLDDQEGTAIGPIDGDTGTFNILESDKSGKDFRAKGKLEYVGEHFQRWTDGDYFMKIGSNSPENLFEYGGFDDSNSTRTFPDHIADWNAGDPTWKGGEGTGIIGAINYLSSKGINSQYFVIHRKEERATPWSIPYDNYYSYDVSKMDQWQIVLDHMMQKGIAAHLVFSESKIQSVFEAEFPSGDPNFSDARKLYFREIIARFGYLNAVIWNLGEENGWNREPEEFVGEEGRAVTTQQRKDFAAYLDELTYYDDFITVHNGPSHRTDIFDDLQGENSIDGISMQGFFGNPERGKEGTEQYRNESAISGKKWVIYYDEAFYYSNPTLKPFRRNVLWSTLTSGGAGVEHFSTEGRDITMEDLRFNDEFFNQMRYAYDLYHDNDIPFYEMYNQDELVENGWCHGTEYNNYVIYITGQQLGTTTIDLTGNYTIQWYNPRTGGALMDGTVTEVSTGADVNIGVPPSIDNEDWVAVVRNMETGPIRVSSIELNPEDLNLELGQTYSLNAVVLPGLADDKRIAWSSSDNTLVTVDSEGTITGVGIGSAVVTARSIDGGFMDTITVVVTDIPEACSADGILIMERYDGIEGFELVDFLNAPTYPDNPSFIREVSEFQIPSNVADNYGVRISGFLCAPETGVYTFWISGDDQVQLNLSPDNQFSNAVKIAYHDSFTAERDWTRFTSQRSAEIQLQQGQKYYIEALMKEGILNENMAVGWRKPSDGHGNVPAEILPASVMISKELGRTAVTNIGLNVSNADIRLNETLKLIKTLVPSNASDKSVVWSSDDPAIVSVDDEGNIFGEAVGTTTIRVTTNDGNFEANATINVLNDVFIGVTGISINPETVNLVFGGTLVLEALVEPSNATNTAVVWASANPSIVSVDSNGELLGISFGIAVVSATTVDGGFSAQTTVTVVENSQVNVTGIDIDIDSANLEIEETRVLSVSVQPENATNTAVSWSSEDASIVSVDSNGVILGVALGTTVISATTEDGSFVAQATITVVEKTEGNIGNVAVSGISIDIDELVLKERDIVQINATVLPENASNDYIIWVPEDNTIVTVDSNGRVVAKRIGETVITATTLDGGFSKTIKITVLPNTIFLYPNPTNDFINIAGIDDRINVFIHNSSGVLVKFAKGGNPIYVGDLSSASYLIRLSTGDRIRFVKR